MARKPYMLFLWSNRNKQPPFLRMQCGYECGGNCRNLLEIQSHSYILGTILQVDHVDPIPTTWRICLLSWGCGHLPGNMEKQKQSLLWQKKNPSSFPWRSGLFGIGMLLFAVLVRFAGGGEARPRWQMVLNSWCKWGTGCQKHNDAEWTELFWGEDLLCVFGMEVV